MKKILLMLILSWNLASAQPCEVKTKTDKFTGAITSTAGPQWATVFRFVNGTDTTYYLSLWAEGFSANYSKKGAIMLFSDGSKIEKPNADIDCKFRQNSMYDYYCYFELTDEDIEALSKKTMTAFRLYAAERSFPEKKALKIKAAMQCLTGEVK